MTNSWAERNLMSTLREWREHAEERGYTRIAELCDYLQADELTHVRLATDWIRKFTDDKPEYRNELVAWSRKAVDVVQGFYNSAYSASEQSRAEIFLSARRRHRRRPHRCPKQRDRRIEKSNRKARQGREEIKTLRSSCRFAVNNKESYARTHDRPRPDARCLCPPKT